MPDDALDASPTDELLPVVYAELKRIAHRHLREVAGTAAISTTELVHEAFLKLARRDPNWEGRAHFFGAAARAMRQVLVDFARRRSAGKRSGGWDRVSLRISGAGALEVELMDVIALDDALERLDAVNPRLRQLVELRFFAGVPEAEIAALLGVSPRTVERDWLKARLFLHRELEPGLDRPVSPGA